MKTKNIAIGYNKRAENKEKMLVAKKQVVLKDLKDVCSKYIEIENHEEFEKDPKKYLLNYLSVKIGIKTIAELKLIELFDLPITTINKLQATYFRNKPTYATDFTIYAKNDKQVNEYMLLLELCKFLNNWKPSKFFWLQRASNHQIWLENDAWTPNLNYIQSL